MAKAASANGISLKKAYILDVVKKAYVRQEDSSIIDLLEDKFGCCLLALSKALLQEADRCFSK